MSVPLPQEAPIFVNQAVDVNVNNLVAGEMLAWSSSANNWTNVDPVKDTSTLTLENVMNIGNTVGANDLNMNNRNIVSAGTISYTALNPPIPGAEGLADTLAVNNSAGANDIDMNDRSISACKSITMSGNITMKGSDNVKHDILEADAIAGQTISANGFSGNEGRIVAAREISTSIYTVNQPYAGQPTNSGIVFNALTTDPTQITGVSTTNPTVCTNLDLRSATNLFTSSPAEIYEWGGYWKNPQTIFPPPPYADPPANPPNYQIPPINQVHLEFVQYDFPGWRYFAPMADNDCQIDPDDYMDLTNGAYIGGEARGGYPDAFYVETAATTVAAHASQTVELWFPVVEYGYGRIYFGLASRDSTSTSAPTVIPQSFRLWMDSENAPGFGDVRSRMCGMKWHIKDFFPTDGTKLHIFPVCRTDDDETTGGRLIIKIGDGQPRNGCNPGEFPEFDPIDNTAQNGQIIMRGYPEPAQWTNYVSTTPPSWQTPGADGAKASK